MELSHCPPSLRRGLKVDIVLSAIMEAADLYSLSILKSWGGELIFSLKLQCAVVFAYQLQKPGLYLLYKKVNKQEKK